MVYGEGVVDVLGPAVQFAAPPVNVAVMLYWPATLNVALNEIWADVPEGIWICEAEIFPVFGGWVCEDR